MPQKISKVVLTLFFTACVLPTFAQKTPKRIALIIGNSAYASPNSLGNPARDAADLAQALTELDFEVIHGVNQNKQQTEKLIEAFGKRLAETRGVGLFYYSGIGIHLNGENFLLPVDAGFTNGKKTAAASVRLNSVLTKMTAAKNVSNIILLDPKNLHPVQSRKQDRVSDLVTTGFEKISAPPRSTVFYSSGTRRTAFERCGRNGYFVASFLKQLEIPQLEFNKLLRNVFDEISLKTNNVQKPSIDGVLSKKLYLVNIRQRLKPKQKRSLESFYNSYREARKCLCGERDETFDLAKEIIKTYGSDSDNQALIEFVKTDIEKLAKDEAVCFRNPRYVNSYKSKNWSDFFAVSREIIAKEGNSALALDVMLTLVSVGFDRAAVDKVNSYNSDTIKFAKQAIQRIEAGAASQTGNYGVFVPFKTSNFPDGKSNALSWMNYIIGWITYNRLGANDPGKKKEALNYFYKSTLANGENKNDYTIYVNIGNYYFDRSAALDAEYRKIRENNNNTETNEAKAKLALARGYTDRAIDAFGRAYKIALKNRKSENILDAFKKKLNELYRYRFNIAPEVRFDGVEIYFEKLISQPMPNPETKIEPVRQ